MVRVRAADGARRPLPGVAPVAMQQGRYAATRRSARGCAARDVAAVPLRRQGQPRDDRPRRSAVADIKGVRLSGFLAWVIWLVVHLCYLIGFQNRLLVLLRWTFSFLTTAAAPG